MENSFDNICCPLCQSELSNSDKENFLICNNCNKEYQVKDEIPILLTQKI